MASQRDLTDAELPAEAHRDIRITAWAAIFILPTAVLPLPLTGTPGEWFPAWSDSTAELASWFADNRARTIVQVFTAGCAYILLIVAVAGLVGFLRRNGADSIWARVLVPAVAASAVGFCLFNGLWLVGTLAGTPSHTETTAPLMRLCFEASVMMWLNMQPIMGFFLLAAGMAVQRCGLLPRHLWTSALIIGVLNVLVTFTQLVSTGWLAPCQPATVIPYGLLFCWVTAAGVAPLRASKQAGQRPRRSEEATDEEVGLAVGVAKDDAIGSRRPRLTRRR